jgi:hypothetical protein
MFERLTLEPGVERGELLGELVLVPSPIGGAKPVPVRYNAYP